MGIYFRDPKVQHTIYTAIGPFYGYFQLIWITLLVMTGVMLLDKNSLLSQFFVLDFYSTLIGKYMIIKIVMVILIIAATTKHMIVSLKAHGRERFKQEKLVSRVSSLIIFMLNFAVVWFAIAISKQI
ncbi:hypothetical protein DZA31_00320 [Arcobacter sp. HD9-500m-PIT-SAG02]|nr:hypothetical protein DZA31_00320 [Arcobacter sp. HD9-500m-PIT-SAG02]